MYRPPEVTVANTDEVQVQEQEQEQVQVQEQEQEQEQERFLIPPLWMGWISKDRISNISIDITNHQTSPTATQGSERRYYLSSPIERPDRQIS